VQSVLVLVVLHSDAEIGGDDPVLGDSADLVVEACFERGFEDFDHPHALGHDEKVVDKHDALETVTVVDFEEKAGIRRGPSVSVGGEESGELL
jgi:hypothetical protein